VALLSFRVLHEGVAKSRLGRLETPHGPLDTPAFFPVATYGAIRGVPPWELRRAQVQGVLCNTYHLHLRPGEAVVEKLGGLHGFLQWQGPMLTDSGGFQLHSLDRFARVEEAGIHFKSPVDGSVRFLSPESCIQVQECLGADLIVILDQFEPIDVERPEARERARFCLERTLRWAERCRDAQRRSDQWLFGIVQGGGFDELRAESATRTAELEFPAYAIGGLGLGETPEVRNRLLEVSLAPLPASAPRYAMGIGKPEDLVDMVERGVDVFDCVLPTRHGRHAAAYTGEGKIHLRNARFAGDPEPLDASCDCPCCREFSRGYLHHLFKVGESLGGAMLSLHNIRYYMRLLESLRTSLHRGTSELWLTRWRAGQRDPDACGAVRSDAASPA